MNPHQESNSHVGDCHTIYNEHENYNKPGVIKNTNLPELEQFQMGMEIKNKISVLYKRVCQGKTRRNAIRRALIYCCVIKICKDEKLAVDDKSLMKKLNVKVSDVNKAHTMMYSVLGEEAEELSILDLMTAKIKILDYNPDIIEDLKIIYNRGMQKISKFNSSRDETLCETIIYYYLKNNLENFDEDDYFLKSNVSKDTILKLYKIMTESL